MTRKSRNNTTFALGSVRIISGRWRGRKLPVHHIEGLRPTGDRIRETLFNWLSPNIPNAHCLDLFAGAGALGFEALSRGAAKATLLELDKLAHKQLMSNQQLLQCETTEIINTDTLKWLSHYSNAPFDIIFLDPPFELNLWDEVLTLLSQSSVIATNTIVYIEHPKNKVITLPSTWQWRRQKSAGDTGFGLAVQA